MRREVMLGGAVVVLLAIAAWGYVTMTSSRSGSVTVAAVGEAPRSGDDAGYTVRYTNAGSHDVTNPQFQTVLRAGEQDWMCQGYQDPSTGDAVLGKDAEAHPLTIPAGQTLDATIYCRIPADVALTSPEVLQRP
jgi:uncharacterized repeat protein (TIGR01451 family)